MIIKMSSGSSTTIHVHQTCKSVSSMSKQWTNSSRAWQQLCKDHPGWEYHLWTDMDNRAFIAQHYSWFLSVFDSYEHNIMRADAIRYFLMYHYGGVYADLDIEPLSDKFVQFVELFRDTNPLMLSETTSDTSDKSGGDEHVSVTNAIMISCQPRHQFWLWVIRYLLIDREHHMSDLELGQARKILGGGPDSTRPWWTKMIMHIRYFQIILGTGPGMLSDAVNTNRPSDLSVLPSNILQPTRGSESVSAPAVVRSTMSGSSWHQNGDDFWPTAGKWFNRHGTKTAIISMIVITVLALTFAVVAMTMLTKSRNAATNPVRSTY